MAVAIFGRWVHSGGVGVATDLQYFVIFESQLSNSYFKNPLFIRVSKRSSLDF